MRALSSVDAARALGPEDLPAPGIVVAVGTVPGTAPLDETVVAMLDMLLGHASATAGASAPPRHDGANGASGEDATTSPPTRKKILLEMAYKPSVTPVMESFGARGWTAVPGLEALVAQGVRQFELWTGIRPDFAVARAAVMGTSSSAAEAEARA